MMPFSRCRAALRAAVAWGATVGLLAAGPLAARQGGPGGPASHLLIVSGLGGAPEYSALFHTQAAALMNAARERWALPPERAIWLAEDPARDPRIRARSTAEAVEREVLALADRAGPSDVVLILLIGHGTAAGEESKLNLPGPDLAGSDLAVWLSGFGGGQTVAIVNTASARGGFVPALSGEGRIVVTATRSSRERERTYFGRYFVDAFLDDGADADHDDRVSLLEAFEFARREVERHYERESQMLTEHALLDDNGDGEGSMEPSTTGADGALAGRFFLAAAPAVAGRAAEDPELAGLLARKAELESRIADLTARKEEMDPEAYDARLEGLLLDLAATNAEIREKGGGA